MTQEPERIDEAMHHRATEEAEREEHPRRENAHRVPVEEPGEEAPIDLPELDQDREAEAAHERERRGMH